MYRKLKQMRKEVQEELEHIPKGPAPQGELRMVYWSRRMHSLSKKAASDQTAKEVLEECIAGLREDYPDYEFKYDKEFFNGTNRIAVKIEDSLVPMGAGGKGHSLSVLMRRGFNVPRGFIATSAAFFKFLDHNGLMQKIEGLASKMDGSNFKEISGGIKSSILKGKIPEGVASKIEEFLKKSNIHRVSIRSSAVSEDSLKASFAGLHDTFLNVKSQPDLVLECVKKCWASLFNERAIAYRLKKSLPLSEGIAVIVQEMVPAEVSGVTFTVHPLNEKALLIEASYGVGDVIVGGKVEPDSYVVDRGTLGIMEKRIGNKHKMSVCQSEGVEVVEVEHGFVRKQAVPDQKVKEIAKASLKAEKVFDTPQDIEWCIANNKLWLLQSRPITGAIR